MILAKIMKVFHSYGSKERLFEMTQKVNNIVLSETKHMLNENIIPRSERIKIIKLFIKFVDNKLKLNKNMPEITISYGENEAKNMKSFGVNAPTAKKIKVVDKNRNLADTLRTLAHELKHTDQSIKGQITQNSGNDGTDIENEANAFAGVVMREFGKKYPIIFE